MVNPLLIAFKKVVAFFRNRIVSKGVRSYRRLVFRGYVAIAILAFAVLAISSKSFLYFPIDLVISKTLQSISFPVVSVLLRFISDVGRFPQFQIIELIIVVFLLALRLKYEALVLVISSFGAFILEVVTKYVIARPRPDEDLVRVVTHLKDYSFPSGHVLGYVAFFGYLAFLAYTLLQRNQLRLVLLTLFYSLILLVGPSRIFLGEHWASDTLGGYLLGTIWLYAVVEIYLHLKKKYQVKLIANP